MGLQYYYLVSVMKNKNICSKDLHMNVSSNLEVEKIQIPIRDLVENRMI